MSLPTLRYGRSGTAVLRMQSALIRAAGGDRVDCEDVPFPQGQTFETDGKFGRITEQALRSFQRTIRATDPNFEVDGVCGGATWRALGFASGAPGSPANTGAANTTSTQRRRPAAQGRVPGQAAATRGQIVNPPENTEMPPWMAVAWREFQADVHERWGVGANPRILEYLSTGSVSGQTVAALVNAGRRNAESILASAQSRDRNIARRRERRGRDPIAADQTQEARFLAARMNTLDEVPWCAGFVTWCMRQVGYPRPHWGNHLSASAWQPDTIGVAACTPRYGAICVKNNDDSFHVGFMIDNDATQVRFLGGNQKDTIPGRRGVRSGGAVNIRPYTEYDSLTFVWPPDIWPSVDPQAPR